MKLPIRFRVLHSGDISAKPGGSEAMKGQTSNTIDSETSKENRNDAKGY